MMFRERNIWMIPLMCVSILINVFFIGKEIGEKKKSNEIQNEVIVNKNENLTNWDVFTLALMKVESEYDNSAISSAGAKGYFQMTPIYVDEVNRLFKTNYTFDDVTDFEKAYEIFDLMQKGKNPDYSIKKAMILHNGNRKWYHNRIYQEMENIKKYEEMRIKVKNI